MIKIIEILECQIRLWIKDERDLLAAMQGSEASGWAKTAVAGVEGKIAAYQKVLDELQGLYDMLSEPDMTLDRRLELLKRRAKETNHGHGTD